MPLLKTERLSTVHKVKALTPKIEERLAKLRNACVAFSFKDDLAKAHQTLLSATSEAEVRESSTRLLALLPQEAASIRVQQAFVQIEDTARRKAWNDEARLLYAALSEVESALKERLAQIEAEDIERGKQLGGTVKSADMIQAITSRLESVKMGRGHLDRGEALEARGYLGQASEISLG